MIRDFFRYGIDLGMLKSDFSVRIYGVKKQSEQFICALAGRKDPNFGKMIFERSEKLGENRVV
jgi:hypothetical protein